VVAAGATLVLLVLARGPARAQTAEASVEPELTDCTGTTAYPQNFGTDFPNQRDWDLDADTVTGTGENTDGGDSTYFTLAVAVGTSNFSAGCIVHVIGPGIHRENITIAQSETVRTQAGTQARTHPGQVWSQEPPMARASRSEGACSRVGLHQMGSELSRPAAPGGRVFARRRQPRPPA
jgi:hypothetical protein